MAKHVSAAAVLRAALVLRAAGASVGSLPRLIGRLRVRNEGTLTIGARLLWDTGTYPSQVMVGPGAVLEIGDEAFINQGADIAVAQSVRIGSRVLLGPMVTITDDGAHDVAPGSPRTVAPVTIEDDVWLGRGVLVLPGVTIGRYSVVAARSVVTRDVPPCTVVAGTPATAVRTFEVPPGWRRR